MTEFFNYGTYIIFVNITYDFLLLSVLQFD